MRGVVLGLFDAQGLLQALVFPVDFVRQLLEPDNLFLGQASESKLLLGFLELGFALLAPQALLCLVDALRGGGLVKLAL